MIIGGRESFNRSAVVELFNTETRQVCTMAAKLPAGITGHSGALYQSVPTICGGAVVGSVPTQTCYQYIKDGASGIMQWTNNVSKPLVTYTFLIIRFSILHYLVFLLLFEVKFLTIHFNLKM